MNSTAGSVTHATSPMDREPRPPTISARAWQAAFQKFATAFPGSFADDAARISKKGLWTEMVMAHPWITEDVFVAGMYLIAWEHEGGFLPEPKTALDFFQAGRAKVDRELAKREAEQRLKLPPPAPATTGWNAMSGPERAAFFERNLAIGKLKARGVVEPDDRDIAEVVAEMRRTGFCRETLKAVAARADAPLAAIGKEVTGAWPR